MPRSDEIVTRAVIGALGLATAAVGTLRGLVWWADYQSKTKPHHGAKRVPPRHPHKEM